MDLADILFIYDLVRVGGIDIFAAGLGEGKVPRCREIIDPCKVLDLIGIVPGYILGAVRGTGVYDDDLVGELLDTV